MKKLLSIILASLFILTLSPVFTADDTGIVSLAVNPYGGEETAPETISWFVSGGGYFLFLPAGTDLTAAKVYVTAAGDVELDGAAVVSGGDAAAFTEGTHTLTCGEQTLPLTVCCSAGLPAVFIETQSGSLDYIHADKAHKEPGSIRIYEDGGLTLDKELKQIKGRGNATWNYPKKPYNIKFDKKTSLFGMPKAKKWTLLAGYSFDNSMLKNAFALDLGRTIGLAETSEYRHIDLYVNGSYLGVYLICESVEVGDNRVEITDLDKANEDANPDIEDLGELPLCGVRSGYQPGSAKWVDIPVSPGDISGGYLLEMDYLYRYHAEPSGFVSSVGAPMVIGSPEYASEAEVAYISGFWNEAEAALYSPTGYNAYGKHYTEYFDMPSLVRCYIAEELTKDVDSGITSFYFYKKAGEDKFYAGPLWDFDHALGSHTQIGNKLTVYEPDTWYANQLHRNSIDTSCANFPTFFAQCYRFSDFRAAVSEQWTTSVSAQVLNVSLPALAEKRDLIASSAVMDHLRWNTYGSVDPAVVRGRYMDDANALISFISARRPMLDKGFASDGAAVAYDGNGAGGANPYDATIYSAGDVAVALPDSTFSFPDKIFAGWNTKADGTGITYQPGDPIVLEAGLTTLYALWETPSEPEPETEPEPEPDPARPAFIQKIVAFFERIIGFFRRLFGIAG